jgi:cytochrome c
MKDTAMIWLKKVFVVVFMALPSAASFAAVDVAAAQALAKKSSCMKCHSVDKKKEGPSFQQTAQKYRDKNEAVPRLVKHLTTSPPITLDGEDDTHDNAKTKDLKEVENLVRWILSH